MKPSWIVGIFMLYILILVMELGVTGNDQFSDLGNLSIMEKQGLLIAPNLASNTNIITAGLSWIPQVVAYVEVFFQVLLLWAPSIFVGVYLWFYWCFIFPVAVGTMFGIVMLIRGVS